MTIGLAATVVSLPKWETSGTVWVALVVTVGQYEPAATGNVTIAVIGTEAPGASVPS